MLQKQMFACNIKSSVSLNNISFNYRLSTTHNNIKKRRIHTKLSGWHNQFLRLFNGSFPFLMHEFGAMLLEQFLRKPPFLL